MITNAFSELTRAETHFRCGKLDIRLTPDACGKRHARANKRGVSLTIQHDVFVSCKRCEIGASNAAAQVLGVDKIMPVRGLLSKVVRMKERHRKERHLWKGRKTN